MQENNTARHYPALLNLRGHFHLEPGLSVPDPTWPPDYPMDAFPVTDKQTILVRAQSTILIDLPSQEILWSITCPALAAALDMERNRLALGAKGRVYLWDLQSGSLLQTFPLGDDDDIATCLAFHPQSLFLAVALYYETIQLWQLTDGQLVQTLSPEEWSAYKSLAFSPDGQFLATGNFEAGEVWLWQIPSGQLVQQMEPAGGRVEGLAFSPDGQLLVCGEAGGHKDDIEMRVWDMGTKRALQGFALRYNPRFALKNWHPTFSPDGKFLASASLGAAWYSIAVWDVATRSIVRRFEAHGGRFHRLRFSPSGQLLVSIGDRQRTVRWWKVESGEELYNVGGGGSKMIQPR